MRTHLTTAQARQIRALARQVASPDATLQWTPEFCERLVARCDALLEARDAGRLTVEGACDWAMNRRVAFRVGGWLLVIRKAAIDYALACDALAA